MVKKIPDWMKNWKKNPTSPPVIWRLANMDGWKSGSFSRATRWDSHSMRATISNSPASTSQSTREMPAMTGASGFGRTQPQVPDRRTPYTVRLRPTIDSRAPT